MERNKKLSRLIAALAVLFILVSSCEKDGNSEYNPPSDHSVSMSGYMHKDGYNQPLTNCVSCRGDALTGGTTGVSCYECHDKKACKNHTIILLEEKRT